VIDERQRAFPVTIRTSSFLEVAGAVVRELGLSWPDGTPVTQTKTEDGTIVVTTSRKHGDVQVTLTEAGDETHPPMESADRSAWGEISGLPGGVSLNVSATGNGSWMDGFVLRGEARDIDHVLQAMAGALTRLLRARSVVSDEVAVPESWMDHARASAPGTYVLGDAVLKIRRWVLDVFQDGWFAIELCGALDESSNSVTVLPIGPLPGTLEDTFFALSRVGVVGEPPPRPTLESLVAALLDEPMPRVPEVKRASREWGTTRRYRTGPWVLLDLWRPAAPDGKIPFLFRIQHERGGPWAVVAEGSAKKNGWAEVRVQIIGDAAARGAVEARLNSWIDAGVYTVKVRR
jgi:hypothetical protein